MKKIFLLYILTLFGCDHGGINFVSRSDEVAKFSYTKDVRTNLCFIASPVSVDMTTYYVYANVPCTPEVESLVQK